MAYWVGDNWWGAGAGAHSHVNCRRFWNVKHPAAYSSKVAGNESPVHGEEFLTTEQMATEELMLRIRLRTGISKGNLNANQVASLQGFVADGHLIPEAWQQGSAVLSQSGRLIADRIVREILL